jgi:hypothetical protein
LPPFEALKDLQIYTCFLATSNKERALGMMQGHTFLTSRLKLQRLDHINTVMFYFFYVLVAAKKWESYKFKKPAQKQASKVGFSFLSVVRFPPFHLFGLSQVKK